MDVITYAIVSALIIMLWHFMMNTSPQNFGLMQIAGIFVLGGFIGWYMGSLFLALMFSVLLSLFFVH